MKLSATGSAVVLVAVCGCGSIQQYELLQQAAGRELQTYVGGAILRIEKEESLPNAFGGADIYGGRRPKGFIELKYLGIATSGQMKLRVLSTDITTNEDWRRRLGREGTATSSSDAVDFEHPADSPFDIEGYQVVFLKVQSSSVTYRITAPAANPRKVG